MVDMLHALQEDLKRDKQQAPWINTEYKCHQMEKIKTALLVALDAEEAERQSMGADGKGWKTMGKDGKGWKTMNKVTKYALDAKEYMDITQALSTMRTQIEERMDPYIVNEDFAYYYLTAYALKVLEGAQAVSTFEKKEDE
ncbi:hypothetical protein ALMA_1386 [Alloscardovia macacae]|uniref:Uncharacterized protein n=2 Tax=Alloscardovia macacae TaxID=1160091 RepID=A0A261F1U2_9BIFI|nr:hypothetical protein ALMA_1386 [Alloscardovia macacae]